MLQTNRTYYDVRNQKESLYSYTSDTLRTSCDNRWDMIINLLPRDQKGNNPDFTYRQLNIVNDSMTKMALGKCVDGVSERCSFLISRKIISRSVTVYNN